ncbi:MAG: DUF3089 domain-containing protein [Bacteroidales bacterium]|nr:DUF3089 domain-containing protein [Bacteroidales bacterium]
MQAKHSLSFTLFIQFLFLAILFAISSCRTNSHTQLAKVIPDAPVYSDSTQWYVNNRNAAVDVFYIISTETGDYSSPTGVPCHFADTHNDSIRTFLYGEMIGVDSLLCSGFNYFSPYYRQCTLQTFTSDSLVSQRIPLALGDVQRAFAYYLSHYNHGRPFILAGFSQGAMAVVDLVKHMDSSTHKRMVAAYVLGWHVADSDITQTPFLLPAHDSADLGVTICYNSVRDNSCAIPMISNGNRFAINPVNWCTDATPATLVSPISHDTLTLTLDTTSLLIHIDGYSPTNYILPLIGREGNYHSLEISLYRHCLRRNFTLRANSFLKKH